MGDIFDQVAPDKGSKKLSKGDIFDQVASTTPAAPAPTPTPMDAASRLPAPTIGRAGESTWQMLKRTVAAPFQKQAEAEKSGEMGWWDHAKQAMMPWTTPAGQAISNLITEGGEKIKDAIDYYNDDTFESQHPILSKVNRGVGHAATDFVTGMAQPESIGTMGVFEAAPAVTGVAGKLLKIGSGVKFGLPAAENAVNKGVKSAEDFYRGDIQGGTEAATGAVFDTGMGAEGMGGVARESVPIGAKIATKVMYPMAERMRRTPTGTGEINPVQAYTPEEIKNYAEDTSNGPVIPMTAAEITEHGALRAIQGIGDKSLTGKPGLENHRAEGQSALISRVKNQMTKLSPNAANAIQTGRSLQEQTTKAAENAKASANTDYANWRQQLGGGPIDIDLTDVNNKYGNMLQANQDIYDNVPNSQASTLRGALEKASNFGVKGKSEPDEFGDTTEARNPVMDMDAVREMRSHWLDSLRELKRKGRSDTKEAALYSGIVQDLDTAIENGLRAHGESISGTAQEKQANGEALVKGWRDANASWKKYTEDFHGDDSVLAQILDTPQTELHKLPSRILERNTGGNPTHIDQMRNYGIDLGGLKREIVQRALDSGFRTPQNKLAGFEDDYLQRLFADNPQELDNLYKSARVGRSINLDFNPSNTAGTMGARSEFEAPIHAANELLKGNKGGFLDEVVGALPGWAASKLSRSKTFKKWMTGTPDQSSMGRKLLKLSGDSPNTPPPSRGPSGPSGGGSGSSGLSTTPALPNPGHSGSVETKKGTASGEDDFDALVEGRIEQKEQAPENQVPKEKRASSLLVKDSAEKVSKAMEGRGAKKAELEKGNTRNTQPTRDGEYSDGTTGDTSVESGAKKLRKRELHRINGEIEKHGKFAESSFPEYKPHATVAYVKPDKANRYVGMDVTAGKSFKIDSIAITDRNGKQEVVKLKGGNTGTRGNTENVQNVQNATEPTTTRGKFSDKDMELVNKVVSQVFADNPDTAKLIKGVELVNRVGPIGSMNEASFSPSTGVIKISRSIVEMASSPEKAESRLRSRIVHELAHAKQHAEGRLGKYEPGSETEKEAIKAEKQPAPTKSNRDKFAEVYTKHLNTAIEYGYSDAQIENYNKQTQPIREGEYSDTGDTGFEFGAKKLRKRSAESIQKQKDTIARRKMEKSKGAAEQAVGQPVVSSELTKQITDFYSNPDNAKSIYDWAKEQNMSLEKALKIGIVNGWLGDDPKLANVEVADESLTSLANKVRSIVNPSTLSGGGKVTDSHVADENGHYEKAKAELGPNASVSDVLKRAQELKIAGGAKKLTKIKPADLETQYRNLAAKAQFTSEEVERDIAKGITQADVDALKDHVEESPAEKGKVIKLKKKGK